MGHAIALILKSAFYGGGVVGVLLGAAIATPIAYWRGRYKERARNRSGQ